MLKVERKHKTQRNKPAHLAHHVHKSGHKTSIIITQNKQLYVVFLYAFYVTSTNILDVYDVLDK